MKNYNCIIVDDEPMARQILESYCRNLKNLSVAASCGNVFEASEVLSKNNIDILFLDINLPVLNGLKFLKTLQQTPQVILTTSYKEYALDAFELGVCDYLLKPISIERFLKAVNKAMSAVPQSEENTIPQVSNTTEKTLEELTFKTDTKTIKIPISEIQYLEATGNYTNVVTDTQEYKIYLPLYKIEETLNPKQFLRIHRSYIVSIDKIRLADSNSVQLSKHNLPIGRTHKEDVKKWAK